MNQSLKVSDWKISPRFYKKELSCPHEIGHGDPKEGTHGCDGCCASPSFKKAWKKLFKEDK